MQVSGLLTGRFDQWFHHDRCHVEAVDDAPDGFHQAFKVEHGQIGLLHVDGKMTDELAPGGHAIWSFGKVITVKIVDTRETALDVTGQEILTKDRVSIRANLSATFKVVDPVLALSLIHI